MDDGEIRHDYADATDDYDTFAYETTDPLFRFLAHVMEQTWMAIDIIRDDMKPADELETIDFSKRLTSFNYIIRVYKAAKAICVIWKTHSVPMRFSKVLWHQINNELRWWMSCQLLVY
eukprot:TRINITY_DN26101_c0_g1_i1.p2 TRINITY_DN26101_c0_g1~~TRINITY_DN26101_c0_g1_i1.p2  ORF type:complete len:118 (+),score=2.57 TRINITY_DN26101_c0_g1_i1:579-932(+)